MHNALCAFEKCIIGSPSLVGHQDSYQWATGRGIFLSQAVDCVATIYINKLLGQLREMRLINNAKFA
jgi:hypothetical protein